MSRPAIRAAAFALNEGLPVDARAAFHIDPEPCPRGRRLVVSVEPLEPSDDALSLAAATLTTIRQSFANDASLPPALALTRALAAASDLLITENRPLHGVCRDRSACIGASAAVLCGHELTVAWVPPTQAIFAQDRRVYGFPDLDSWLPSYVPASDEPEPLPLGYQEGSRPALVRTRAAHGDLLLLCSSSLARCLRRDRAAMEVLARRGRGQRPDSTEQIDAVLERLAVIAAQHGLDDCHAAAVAIGDLANPFFGARQVVRGGWQRGVDASRAIARPLVPTPAATGLSLSSARASSTDRPEGRIAVSSGRSQLSSPDGCRLDPGYGIATFVTRMMARSRAVGRQAVNPRPNRTKGDHRFGRAHETAPCPLPRMSGVSSVRRYTKQSTAPADWRSHVPRAAGLRLPGRVLAIAGIALAAFGGSGFALAQHLERAAVVDGSLAAVDDALRWMPSDPAAGLLAADGALAEARRAGGETEDLGRRQRAVDDQRDTAWAIARFARFDRIGSLPPELSGEARLLRASGRVYLVDRALYELDAGDGRLIRVLGPADRIGNAVVSDLRLAAGDAEGVVCTDGSMLYARDAAGNWLADPLPSAADDKENGRRPSALYDGRLYTVSPEGEIVRYKFGTSPSADLWADADQASESTSVRDLVIDGSVHLLLTDGRVQTRVQGSPVNTVSPLVVPPLGDAVAMAGGPEDNALYLLDVRSKIGTAQGRIVRLSPSGNATQILPPRESADATQRVLSSAHDLMVDEARGVVYLLTKDAIWRGELPPAQ